MTILGKILVFLNLVFSLITAALIVTVFVTRTNWRAGYEDMQTARQVADLNARTYQAENQGIRNDARKAQEDLAREQARHKDALLAKDQELAAASRALAEEQTKAKTATALTTATTEEARRRQAESENYQKQLAASEARRVDAERQAKKAQDEGVAARIAATSEHERNRQLLDVNEQLVKDLDRERTRGGGSAGAAGITQALKPPPEDVQGVITDSDPRTGLVTISIGSDSGIQVGHTLEVFRYEPRPQYVGTIKIADAQFHQSVGRVIPPLAPGAGQVRKGDRVATKLGGLTNSHSR